MLCALTWLPHWRIVTGGQVALWVVLQTLARARFLFIIDFVSVILTVATLFSGPREVIGAVLSFSPCWASNDAVDVTAKAVH